LSTAEEATMKRWLGKVFALLRKSNQTRPAVPTERPGRAPALEVRTQVKAGSYNVATNHP
jgi:hypothetical protein